MRQANLFTRTKKESPKDEVSVNAQLLIRAGYADKLMAGVYAILPLGWRVMKKIENIIRKEMDAIGGQEMFMPTLQPKANWETTGRWTIMEDDLYKFKDESGRDYLLGPTHEEVLVPLVKKFVNSYKDLPFAAYQFQNKFRKEKRAKSGLLRGREFIMKDLYSFHSDEKDLDEYYQKAENAYVRIFNQAGIGEKTHKTFASGSSFSKYSHEFQTITPAGEDKIHICAKCSLAINEEIRHETPACPDCGGTDFREEKSVEVGNIFKLNNKYTKPFNLTVKDDKGEDVEVLMGCYGIGLQRLMGTIVEINHDGKGIVWPESVAPFRAHLVLIEGRDSENSQARNEAEKIYQDLEKQGVEVLYDDRSVSAGEKFSDADLLGMPYRLVVSEKSLAAGGVELKKRTSAESEIVSLEELVGRVK